MNNNINIQSTNNYNWKITIYNIRDLNDNYKLNIINQWIIYNDFDFTVLTETKLKPNYKSRFNLNNYKYTAYYDSSEIHTYNKEVAIIIKNTWSKHIESITKYKERLLHLVLKFKGKKIIHILGCYTPALTTKEDKKEVKKISKYISNILSKNKTTIIARDINKDYHHYNKNIIKYSITTNILSKGMINTYSYSDQKTNKYT